jgi:monofunctional biosynthetic peptidoglycan transglycosylase
VALGALGLWCSVPDTAPLATRNPTSTAFIDLRRDDAAAAGKPFSLRWQWRPLGGISRYLRAAVIYAEDYNFYHHDGVDWQAIEHALSTDLKKGRLSVGGSTITQQLAKNLYLSPRRSLFRKAREVLIAYALEDRLSKQRILELYLNVVEWGDGVFGAEAAARTWFHHGASALSPAEAVRLATALPNPITRAPNVRSPELIHKAVRLIRLLRMQGLIDAAQERTALDEVGASGERVLPDRAAEAAAVLESADQEPDQPVTSPHAGDPPPSQPEPSPPSRADQPPPPRPGQPPPSRADQPPSPPDPGSHSDETPSPRPDQPPPPPTEAPPARSDPPPPTEAPPARSDPPPSSPPEPPPGSRAD